MGDSISPNDTTWFGRTTLSTYNPSQISYDGTEGFWFNENLKYMGVRFASMGQIHYGWVRMSLDDNSDSLTVHDFAYNPTPGVGLTAGQGIITSVINREPLNTKIYVYDRSLFVNLPAQSSTEGNIRLFNAAGQVVQNVVITDLTMRVALTGLPTGIYFVQVQQNGQSTTRKIYVQ
jgi:hypothetical protein